MSSLLLTMASARWRWHQDFENQWRAMPLQVRTRTRPAALDGAGNVLRPARTESYHVQPKPAPSGAKDLMTDLIFLNMQDVEKRSRALGSVDLLSAENAAPTVPGLSVNCVKLGKRR